jgi:hypothetical protein
VRTMHLFFLGGISPQFCSCGLKFFWEVMSFLFGFGSVFYSCGLALFGRLFCSDFGDDFLGGLSCILSPWVVFVSSGFAMSFLTPRSSCSQLRAKRSSSIFS